jgi:Leucine-rich repeat (LRR) protein
MPPMTTLTSNPKRKRRWLQFSVRGLLLLTVVIAVPLGLINKARQQRIAVTALRKMGCSVSSWNAKSGSPTILEWSRMLMGEEQFRDVTCVYGTNLQITDADLVHLEGLKQLQILGLNGTQVTDSGLVHLEGLTQLQSLGLGDTQITDSGLVHLQSLAHLTYLYIVKTQVTDVGVQELEKALPNCRIWR